MRCFPDLAGGLAQSGLLSPESTKQQKSTGLLDATEDERATMKRNNEQYKAKFGFPFVICARKNKKNAIIEGITKRLGNDRDTEVRIGIEEVKKIGYLRLCDIVCDNLQAKL